MFYIDWTYLVYVLPALLFAAWASARVNSTFNRYSKVTTFRGMSGRDAARAVLDANGLYDVRIERVGGNLTDHYDPKSNVIRLSDSTYANTSCAAIGVAAHEAGHAIQHATGYVPIRIRTAIVPITNIGSKLSMPLILIGILLSALGEAYAMIAYIGVACFALSTLFQLVTLPTEFNASRRALAAIEGCGMLTEEETGGAKKVLSAAALTYVAALFVSIMQLLRLLTIVNRSSGRRR
ncbi:MAG: zinc metallopeptidase [Clostridia bacterium]|nr:zinc metallopeptidase [Clostridia bacterium]